MSMNSILLVLIKEYTSYNSNNVYSADYITPDWKRQALVLGCIQHDERHTSAILAEWIVVIFAQSSRHNSIAVLKFFEYLQFGWGKRQYGKMVGIMARQIGSS